jgi:hypothetical protein
MTGHPVILLATVLTLFLAACGGDGDSGSSGSGRERVTVAALP